MPANEMPLTRQIFHARFFQTHFFLDSQVCSHFVSLHTCWQALTEIWSELDCFWRSLQHRMLVLKDFLRHIIDTFPCMLWTWNIFHHSVAARMSIMLNRDSSALCSCKALFFTDTEENNALKVHISSTYPNFCFTCHYIPKSSMEHIRKFQNTNIVRLNIFSKKTDINETNVQLEFTITWSCIIKTSSFNMYLPF